MATLGAHYFDQRVVVVAAGRVDRNAGGLVDDDEVVVLVDDADGLRRYRRLVSMEGVRNYVAVFDDCMN